MLDGDGDASLAAAVEFGEDDACEADGVVKLSGLHKGVGAGGGVEHDPLLVRGCGIPLAEGADDLGEFLHEVVFGMEASGGVAEEEIDIASLGTIPSIVA